MTLPRYRPRRSAVLFATSSPSSIPLLGLDGPPNVLRFGWDILAVYALRSGPADFAVAPFIFAAVEQPLAD